MGEEAHCIQLQIANRFIDRSAILVTVRSVNCDRRSHTSATTSTNVSRNDSSSVGGLVAVGGGVRGSTRGREGGRADHHHRGLDDDPSLSLPLCPSVQLSEAEHTH